MSKCQKCTNGVRYVKFEYYKWKMQNQDTDMPDSKPDTQEFLDDSTEMGQLFSDKAMRDSLSNVISVWNRSTIGED